jgi:hypothetical protein
MIQRLKLILEDCLAIMTAGAGGLVLFLVLRKRSPLMALIALDTFIFMLFVDCIAIACLILLVCAVFAIMFLHSSKLNDGIPGMLGVLLPLIFFICEVVIIFARAIGFGMGHYLRYPIPTKSIHRKLKQFLISKFAYDEQDELMLFSIEEGVRALSV